MAESPGLKNSLNKTSLDVENSTPNGGPLSYGDLDNNYTQKYSPSNTYLDMITRGGNGSGDNSIQSSKISDFGIEGTNLQPNNIFEQTSLDTISDLASTKLGGKGGPNRQDPNRFNTVGSTGTYVNKRASTSPLVTSPLAGTPIETRDGKESKTELSQYSSTNTYLESMKDFKTDNKI